MLAVVVWRTLFDVVALGVCIRLVVLVVCGVRGVCVVVCLYWSRVGCFVERGVFV